MREFNNETELAENEYLLKIDARYDGTVGFLTKLNKGNKLPPKPFLDWGTHVSYPDKIVTTLNTWIVEQNLCKGWKVEGYRRGESQDWIEVVHPDGYILEITTSQFLELVPKISIIKGKITQALRWDRGVLKLD
jgi:hypothetical protein